MNKIVTRYVYAGLCALLSMAWSSAAYATGDISAVANNIVTSSEELPGLLAGLSYLLGLVFCALGIIKAKEYVDNPREVTIRWPIINFLAGGALFALPIVYEAMAETIGKDALDVESSALGGLLAGAIGGIIGGIAILTQDFNTVLVNISDSFAEVPGIIAAVAYLLGLLLGVTGILKLKEHVENPQQVGLREGVIRLLIGGALFSLPQVYNAMFTSIEGDGTGWTGIIAGVLTTIGLIMPTETISTLTPGCFAAIGTGGMGLVICSLVAHTLALPRFFIVSAYLFGLVVGLWGLLKLKDHVLEPRQTSIWEGVSRLIVAGGFFALPALIDVAYNTLAFALAPHFNTGFTGAVSAGGLDAVMAGFMDDIFGPMNVIINWFGMVAGILFVMIGVSRLMKSAQEGPRGPGGIGTIMTFLVGGALLSLSPMIAAFTSSFFTDPLTNTQATLQYTTGMGAPEVNHAHAVISAVLKFMIVLGIVSFARGLFIVRAVAEGNSQASLMAGVTHLIGGALAVNLGPLMNAVQTTLGLTAYGVNFT